MNHDLDDQHDELARRVQAVMREHDHEAPAPGTIDFHTADIDAPDIDAARIDAADRARPIAFGRTAPTRRVLIGGLAAAAVLAAAVLSVALPRHHAVDGTAGAPPSSTSSASRPSATASDAPTTPPPIGTRIPLSTTILPNGKTLTDYVEPRSFVPVQFRGLRLLYPGGGGGPCPDKGLSGVVYLGPKDRTYFDSCRAAPDPKNPVLVFAATDAAEPLDVSAATTPTTIDGVPALTGSRNGYDYIVVPSLKVMARFSVGTPEQTAEVTPTASIVTTDDYGCPLHIDASGSPRNTVGGTSAQLVPGQPVSVLDCRYTGSDVATPGVPTDLSHPVSATQQALNRLSGSTTTCAVYTDRDRHVLFTYADGYVLDVRIRETKCTDVVVFSNGSVTRVGTATTVPFPI